MNTSDTPAGLGGASGGINTLGEHPQILPGSPHDGPDGCLSCTLTHATTPTNVPAALGDPISCSNYPMACQIFNLKKMVGGGSEIERLKEHSSTDRHSTRTWFRHYVLTPGRPTEIAPEAR